MDLTVSTMRNIVSTPGGTMSAEETLRSAANAGVKRFVTSVGVQQIVKRTTLDSKAANTVMNAAMALSSGNRAAAVQVGLEYVAFDDSALLNIFELRI